MGDLVIKKADGKKVVIKPDGSKIDYEQYIATKYPPDSPELRGGDVLVLGAGFSHSITKAAPVMESFLFEAKKNGFYDPMDRHQTLCKAVNHYFGDEEGISANIEELATLLTDESNEFFSVIKRKESYNQLLEVIKSTLSPVWDKAVNSGKINDYRKLAKSCVRHKVPVISFN